MATGRVPTTANSPLTAKGDLFTYSTAPARLAVGNNGESLVADSSTATGLRYQSPVQQNPVLNSSFQNWQRGTSFTGITANNTYTADRWSIGTNGTYNSYVSRQNTSDTTNLPNIQYCARVGRTSGNTSTSNLYLVQSFETVNSIPFAGKTVTYSFYARAGANYSPSSSILTAYLLTGTGTDQSGQGAISGGAYAIASNATLTTTWQRFTFTGTVPTTATQLFTQFMMTPTGTAGANDYFEVTGVQLEVGSVATPFKTYAGTIQGELAACQRYYQRFQGDANANIFAPGNAYNTTRAFVFLSLPVSLRGAPTVGKSTSVTVQLANYQFATVNSTDVIYYSQSNNYSNILLDIRAASGLTGKDFYSLYMTATTQYIELSSEL